MAHAKRGNSTSAERHAADTVSRTEIADFQSQLDVGDHYTLVTCYDSLLRIHFTCFWLRREIQKIRKSCDVLLSLLLDKRKGREGCVDTCLCMY